MADIFISYSRKNSGDAVALADKLRAEGVDVWLDQYNIEGAEQWAAEIVNGINGCTTFLLLISPDSISSEQVLRELALATEKRKRILPVDLQATELPVAFQYPLAGLQHVAITDVGAIIRGHKYGPPRQIRKDERKSLMILPFEDLSPSHDNEWLANGVVSELIDALSSVRSLRLTDHQTTKQFKKYNGLLSEYAGEMNIRYFLQGEVRKFGDRIKISTRLLDIETGDYLWHEAMQGTMDNIFDFQEEVALNVVEGLKVHLAPDELKRLAEHGTENAEAYELLMKAYEYYQRLTKEGFQLAVQLATEAIRLDPGYALAYQYKANALTHLYRSYDRNAGYLDEAEALCVEALRLKPDLASIYQPLSLIYMHRGDLDAAENAAKEFIRRDPKNYVAHFTLGFYYNHIGESVKSIAAYEAAASLKPERLATLWNLVANCDTLGDHERRGHWAAVALPYYERHIKLHPDEEGKRVQRASLLLFCGLTQEAHTAILDLADLKDGNALFNAAALLSHLGDHQQALRMGNRAIEAGYQNLRYLKEFITDEDLSTLRDTEDFVNLKQRLDELETGGKHHG